MKPLISLFTSVKKFIAISLTITFIAMCFKGQIDVTSFMSVFTLVVGTYFGQSIARNNREK